MGKYIDPLDELISSKFIPTLFDKDVPFGDCYRDLMTLKPGDGGLGIQKLSNESKRHYKCSKFITKPHVQSIERQNLQMLECDDEGRDIKELKKICRTSRNEEEKLEKEEIIGLLPDQVKDLVIQAQDKGASAWLNALPIKEQHLDLNKDEFRDALRIRYDIKLDNLPSKCACGEMFNVNHALKCMKGGFIVNRHDNIRDLLTVLLNKTCTDVQSEPTLMDLDNEQMKLKSATMESESRLDIKARGFWQHGVNAFFDIRVTHTNSKTNHNKTTKQIFRNNEMEKKRKYMERILEVEHATFTPLIFGTNGGMGVECERFIKVLATKLAEKQNEEYHQIITWLRIRLSFAILRSILLCVRESRIPFRRANDGNWIK